MTLRERTNVEPSVTLDDLRDAAVELFGAERRLRGRDMHGRNLTNSQLWALSALRNAEEVTAGQMAKSADLNPASITGMLVNLEESGIIERRRDIGDRRVCMVSLTPKGRAIVTDQHERWVASWDEWLGDLSSAEREVAQRVLRKITLLLDDM